MTLPITEPVLRAVGLCKHYHTPSGPFHALSDIDLTVNQGEFVAVVGKSGCGKSTLLNLLTGIDSISAGEVWIEGQAVHRMSESALARWRGARIGVVFQFFQLLPTLTIIENVMLPMDFCATVLARERHARAMAVLARLGIADQADKLPAALSGGQQQRAAIARALANDPAVLVADEPTGNLDGGTAHQIMALFGALAASGKTILMVTHEREFAPYFTRTITLVDGKLLAAAPASVQELHHA